MRLRVERCEKCEGEGWDVRGESGGSTNDLWCLTELDAVKLALWSLKLRLWYIGFS
jgi:hypothetical protein